MGFRVESHQRIRLTGVDTAEIYGVSEDSNEYIRGIEHKEFVEEWLSGAPDGEYPLMLRTDKETGKYGRWAGDIFDPERAEWLTDVIVDVYPSAEDE